LRLAQALGTGRQLLSLMERRNRARIEHREALSITERAAARSDAGEVLLAHGAVNLSNWINAARRTRLKMRPDCA